MSYQPLIIVSRKTTHLLVDQYAEDVPCGPVEAFTACGRIVTGLPGIHIAGDFSVSCGTCRQTSIYRSSQRRWREKTRTFGDVKPGDRVGNEIVLRTTGPDSEGLVLLFLTGDGYQRVVGRATNPAPEPGEPSRRALAEYALDTAARNVESARERFNATLPKIPAGLTADLENETQLYCPHPGCTAQLTAVADTTERSPVLGWGASDAYDHNGGKPFVEEVTALWVGDYEYGDASGGIHSISCWNGHAWQVPDHTDRNV